MKQEIEWMEDSTILQYFFYANDETEFCCMNDSRISCFSPPQIIPHIIQPVYCFPKLLLWSFNLWDDLLSSYFCRNPCGFNKCQYELCLVSYFAWKAFFVQAHPKQRDGSIKYYWSCCIPIATPPDRAWLIDFSGKIHIVMLLPHLRLQNAWNDTRFYLLCKCTRDWTVYYGHDVLIKKKLLYFLNPLSGTE